MENHGITTLGRTISEAYHRLNTLTSEIRRNILAELLASAKGTEIHYLDQQGVDWMYQQAERVIYPSRFSEGKPKVPRGINHPRRHQVGLSRNRPVKIPLAGD